MICNTYPEIFRGFQFHSKQNNYFKGSDGKKNYLYELVWVIENKMGLKLKNIDTYASNNTFLRTKDLGFYGLGSHTYKHLFNNVDDIKNELIKMYGNKNQKPNEKTDKLRPKLIEAGFPFVCAVEGCKHSDPQTHHIIPKRNQKGLDKFKTKDPDHVDNLVFLCPNHHAIADKMDWLPLFKASNNRRDMLLGLLNEQEKNFQEKTREVSTI
ncbi:HNH endonuclease signature motif containing protein [Neobacillus vireti]|uniref:HNH endonuclease signature motif containing protein n=1 Tax=Neobacillus vireti TaxID=220686 RepID=UPI002FFDAD8E